MEIIKLILALYGALIMTVALYYQIKTGKSNNTSDNKLISVIKNKWPLYFFGILGISLLVSSWVISDTKMIHNWSKNYQPEVITGKTYQNQEVLLDGFSYIGCTFKNVTFIYNGTTPIKSFSHNRLNAPRFRSENPSINAMLVILQGLGYFRKDLDFDNNLGVNVQPPENVR